VDDAGAVFEDVLFGGGLGGDYFCGVVVVGEGIWHDDDGDELG